MKIGTKRPWLFSRSIKLGIQSVITCVNEDLDLPEQLPDMSQISVDFEEISASDARRQALNPPLTLEQSPDVQNLVCNFRPLLQTAFDGCRNGLARLSAQTGLLVHQDRDSAETADDVGAGADAQPDANLLFHPRFHMPQIAKAAQVFQPLQQAFLVLAGQT
jgi:hypothetical protein